MLCLVTKNYKKKQTQIVLKQRTLVAHFLVNEEMETIDNQN